MSEENLTEKHDSTSWKEAPLLALKGFLMGSADIVPGVSGGTMALIVGIYNRLIHAISSFDLRFIILFFTFRWKKAFRRAHWKFMLVLLSGILCAAMFFTRVIPLQTYMFTDPEIVFGLFFGLIVGSIIILAKALDEFSWANALFIIVGVIIGLWVVTRVPAETPESTVFIFLSGALAICAMVLPGISGSYILLILRKYDFLLTRFSQLGSADTVSALWALAPFILGAIAGLMLFTRILSWLLDHHYTRTLAVLIGFLIGSLYVIWPYQNRTYQSFVSKTEVVQYQSEEAQAIRKHPGNEDHPKYRRLGEVINPNALVNEKRVKIETVNKKLVSSTPYIPFTAASGNQAVSLWSGFMGMFVGLGLVLALEWLQSDAKYEQESI